MASASKIYVRPRSRSERKFLNYPKFLKVFQGYPVLWDISHHDYNDKIVSKRCFSQLKEQLGELDLLTDTTDASLRKRIWHIQKTYKEEKEKIMQSGGCYTPKKKWFKHAYFLDKSLSPFLSISDHTKVRRKHIPLPQSGPFSPRSSQMDYSEASNSQMDYSEASNSPVVAPSQMDYSEPESSLASVQESEEFSLPERSIPSTKNPTVLRNVVLNAQRTSPTSNGVRHTVTPTANRTPSTLNAHRSPTVVCTNSVDHNNTIVSPGANPKLPGQAFLNYVVSEFQDLTKDQARDLQDEIYKCISCFRKTIE